MNIIYRTGVASIIIQVCTWFIDLYVLTIKYTGPIVFLKNLLWIEFAVQLVEGMFYFWMIRNFANIKNITQYRYYDWVITTPSMLFTYCMYLIYLKTMTPSVESIGTISSAPDKLEKSFLEIVQENTPVLVPIAILNTLMLLFGYLAEIGKISFEWGAVLGFLPFFAFFYLIYENYAKYTTIGQMTFVYFISVWGLYGVASLFSYKYKNIAYNVLDLFAKNFFGVFLAVVLLLNKPKTE